MQILQRGRHQLCLSCLCRGWIKTDFNPVPGGHKGGITFWVAANSGFFFFYKFAEPLNSPSQSETQPYTSNKSNFLLMMISYQNNQDIIQNHQNQ